MKNRYEINGDVTTIYLCYKSKEYECLIDTEDLEKVSNYNWYCGKDSSDRIYPKCNFKADGKTTTKKMNRVILECSAIYSVTNKNGKLLDNRKSNLKTTINYRSKSQNKMSMTNNWRLQDKSIIGIDILHKGKCLTAFIDAEDFDKVNKVYRWSIHDNGKGKKYVKGSLYKTPTECTRVSLHGIIMEDIPHAREQTEIDHFDGNPLNNRKNNLNYVTTSENQQNRKLSINNISGTPGLSWDKSKNRWLGRVSIGGKRITIGQWRKSEKEIAKEKVKEGYKKYHTYI